MAFFVIEADGASTLCSTTHKLQGLRGSSKQPNHDEIWADMLAAEREKFVLTCAVPDDPSVDLMSVAGLVEGHAYGILDVREVIHLCGFPAVLPSWRC